MIKEVSIISHSCGVMRPRQMKRKHVRIVEYSGKSVPMSELYPRPDILPEFAPSSRRKPPAKRPKTGFRADSVGLLLERM